MTELLTREWPVIRVTYDSDNINADKCQQYTLYLVYITDQTPNAVLNVRDWPEMYATDIAGESRRWRSWSRQHGSVQGSEDFPCFTTAACSVTLGRHEGKSQQSYQFPCECFNFSTDFVPVLYQLPVHFKTRGRSLDRVHNSRRPVDRVQCFLHFVTLIFDLLT